MKDKMLYTKLMDTVNKAVADGVENGEPLQIGEVIQGVSNSFISVMVSAAEAEGVTFPEDRLVDLSLYITSITASLIHAPEDVPPMLDLTSMPDLGGGGGEFTH